MTFLRVASAGLLLVPIATAAELATLDGKKVTGEIVSIVDNELTFKSTTGEEKFLVTAISAVTVGPAPKGLASGTKHTVVELTDGSVFRCESISLKGKAVEMKLLGASPRTVSVPMTSVFSINREAGDLKLEQDFRRLVRGRSTYDRFVYKRKTKNDQSVEVDELDAVEGTFGEGDAEAATVKFTRAVVAKDGEPKESDLRMINVSGMIFNQRPAEKVAPAMCKVIDADGHELVAQAVAKTPTGYAVTTVSEVKFDLAANQVSKFDFAAGSVKYLSDLEPIALEQSGTNPEPYQKDKNLDKQPIRLVTEPGTAKPAEAFPKGLTLKAKTVITYELKGQYKTLRALAGVDADPQNEANSQVRLTIDDGTNVLYKGVIKKGEKPVELTLSVQNVEKLKITAESDVPGSDFGNQVSLANARVVK
jgi:stress response protein SCP2